MKAGDKVYLVKYALTKGIEGFKVSKSGAGSDYIHLDGWWGAFKSGKEVFASMEDAVAAAEAMRMKKIASLRKQIAKLEKMDFAASTPIVVKG